MKAKLINNTIEYFKQPNWILGDATSYAIENGFKEVLYQSGDNGIYETDTNIIIETLKYKLTNEEIKKIREQQYKMRSDSFYMAYQKYTALDELEKANQAKQQWLDEINKIDIENPYNQ